MALVTCGDMITTALRTAGITGTGQTPIAEDFTAGLDLLSTMVAGWQRRRWLVADLVDLAITATGAASYTIGPTRPDRIESAYARLLNSAAPNRVDVALNIIPARENYNEIALKSLSTIPTAVFYDTAWPVGLLYFWPIPPAGQYELHVTFKAPLPTYAALTDLLAVPPEYLQAMLYGLAVQLAMNYGLEPKASHVAAYRVALATVRMANVQIPTLNLPSFGGHGSGGVSAGSSPAFQSGMW